MVFNIALHWLVLHGQYNTNQYKQLRFSSVFRDDTKKKYAEIPLNSCPNRYAFGKCVILITIGVWPFSLNHWRVVRGPKKTTITTTTPHQIFCEQMECFISALKQCVWHFCNRGLDFSSTFFLSLHFAEVICLS